MINILKRLQRRNPTKIITYSSCFYILKSKFNPSLYIKWMKNFVSIVNNFNLVIYTNLNFLGEIEIRENDPTSKIKNNPSIKIIIKPLWKFYCYRHKDLWIANHYKNSSLKEKTSWELNMLWNEKIAFVNETIKMQYFKTELYGWCDIGYFRNRPNDTHTSILNNWSSFRAIHSFFKKDMIYYGCINNDHSYLKQLKQTINTKNDLGLPSIPIPEEQFSISGGFFILHKDKINWWFNTFYQKLNSYLINDYLVKDDQIILADCIFTNDNIQNFFVFHENINKLDNWFMFQRILR